MAGMRLLTTTTKKKQAADIILYDVEYLPIVLDVMPR
jgi:hypothetical protein